MGKNITRIDSVYSEYDDEDEEGEGGGGANDDGGEGEDLINYKGIYFADKNEEKYTDPETGAHFEFKDLCKRISKMSGKREVDY